MLKSGRPFYKFLFRGLIIALLLISTSEGIIAQSATWTWMAGSSSGNANGVYGTKGVASRSNIPGGREASGSWSDANGNMWIFGGYGYPLSGTKGYLNDLWKWDGSSWTWLSGSNTITGAANYGTKGVASSSNTPGSRISPTTWIDSNGNLWLFGGCDGYNVFFNDLWKWDGVNWTWISGNNTGSVADVVNGVYGTKGVAANNNVPGSRYCASGWTDASGNLWLYAGACDSYPSYFNYNDLWKWDGSNWTWVNGENTTNYSGTYGVYGSKGVAASSNLPGSRRGANIWLDNQGKVWMFGGYGNASSLIYSGMMNDLWKWDGSNWTWITGGNNISNGGNNSQVGTYGTKGVTLSTNLPPGRDKALNWIDQFGNLCLYGGRNNSGYFNDLWKFDGTNWTWISGLTTNNNTSSTLNNFGTKGITTLTNMPALGDFVGYYKKGYDVFLFGGNRGYYMNDTWKMTEYSVTSTIDGNWSSASTWLNSVVPTSTDLVSVQNNVTLDNSLTFAGACVQSSNGILNLGSNVITATSGITVAPGGALVGSSSNVNGTVTLQQNILPQRGWRVFSNPFSASQSFSTLASNNSISIHTSSSQNNAGISDNRVWSNQNNAWTDGGVSVASNTPYGLFIRGLANEVTGLNYTNGPSAFTYSVRGTLNSSSITQTPNNTGNFMLIGNPFAAPVNTQALTGGVSMPYYTYKITQGGNINTQRIKAGSWVAASGNSSVTNTIPVMSVLCYMPSSLSSFNITTSDINTTGTIQTGVFSSETPIQQMEIILNHGQDFTDKLFIRTDSVATSNGNDRVDLIKYENESTNFYTIAPDKKRLAVDARKQWSQNIPLGIYSGIGLYSIVVENNTLPSIGKVYLNDKYLNKQIELNAGSRYDFVITADSSSFGEKRFELFFGKISTSSNTIEASSSELEMQILGNAVGGVALSIKVNGIKPNQVGNISLVDMSGRVVTTKTVVNGLNIININPVSKGVQLIKLSNGENQITKKFIKL
jgi:hypothetical protein